MVGSCSLFNVNMLISPDVIAIINSMVNMGMVYTTKLNMFSIGYQIRTGFVPTKSKYGIRHLNY